MTLSIVIHRRSSSIRNLDTSIRYVVGEINMTYSGNAVMSLGCLE